jgi:hypothetical protein
LFFASLFNRRNPDMTFPIFGGGRSLGPLKFVLCEVNIDGTGIAEGDCSRSFVVLSGTVEGTTGGEGTFSEVHVLILGEGKIDFGEHGRDTGGGVSLEAGGAVQDCGAKSGRRVGLDVEYD